MSAEIKEQSTVEKPRRGRPRGSKTKNRIRAHEDSILVPRPIRRPLHYNQVEAAAELGVSHDVLYRHSCQQGGIYKPSGKIYTDLQIKIISFVMRGKLTPEQGLDLFQQIDDEELLDMARRARGNEK